MTRRILLGALLILISSAFLAAGCMMPSIGAAALLHSWRRSPPAAPAIPHEDLMIPGDGIDLCAWRFPARGPRRGLLVYLHGSSDDRRGAVGIAERFTPLGFDVLAWDSRAHGRSGGDACTYGVREKRDLSRVLDWYLGDLGEGEKDVATAAEPGSPARESTNRLDGKGDLRAGGNDGIGGMAQAEVPRSHGPVVLIGFSLGGSIALQAAAEDPRVSLVVAIAPFSDLRTIAAERAPFFMTRGQVEKALRLAEEEGGFRVDDASPLAAAPRIHCPVLLVHGAADRPTPPAHSERIHAALECEKELVLVPGLRHDHPLPREVWSRIEAAVEVCAPGVH